MMMRPFFSSACSIAEHRLCRNINAPSSGPVPGMVERGTQVAADWTLWLTGKGINLGSQMKEGLVYAWNKDARSEELKNAEMQQTGEFMQYAPKNILELVQSRFEACLAKGERPTLTQIAALTSLPNWIDAFGDTTLFEEPTVLQESTLFTGPAGLLWSVDVPTRKILFHDLVTEKLLPSGAQMGFEGTFGALTLKKEESAEYMTHPTNQATIVSALQGMMGKDMPAGGVEEQIAQAGLLNRYYVDGKTSPVGPLENLRSSLVRTDLEQLARGSVMIRSVEDIVNKSSRSFLAGASKLGVLPPDALNLMLEERRIGAHQQNESQIESGRKIADLMGAVDKDLRKEAKNFGTIWRDLPPIAKLALPIIGIFALAKSKVARGMAAGIATYYFGAKFLMKMENPWAPVQRLVDKSSGMGKGVLPDWLAPDEIQTTDRETIMRRQGIVETFMKKELRDDINTSSEAFNMLYDIPIAHIAQFLDIPPGTTFERGMKARLRVWDPAFQKMVRDSLKAKSLKTSSVAAVFGPTGEPAEGESSASRAVQARIALETGDALSTLMFLKGSKPGDPRGSQVEQAVKQYTVLGTYDELPADDLQVEGGVFVNPQRLYCELRAEGMTEVLESSAEQTLGGFIIDALRLGEAPDTKGKVEIENTRFNNLKTAIENYEFPAGTPVHMEAVRGVDLVTIDVKDSGYALPLTMTVQDFVAAKDHKEILEKWVNEGFKKKEEVMKRTNAYGTAPWQLKLIGSYVGMYAGQVNAAGVEIGKAKSSAYKFLSMPIEDIRLKYVTWFESHWLVLPPVTPTSYDPL